MKHKLFKTMIAISSIAMICACGDDSGNTSEPNNGGTDLSSSSAQQNDNGGIIVKDPCAKYKVVSPGWVEDLGNGDYLVIDQASTESGRGIVYDTAGKVTSYYFTLEVVDQVLIGHVYDNEGIWIDMNMSVKPFCQANTTPDGQPISSASTEQNPNNPTSSATTAPNDSVITSSAATADTTSPASSAETAPEESSSSSAEPLKPTGNPEEDIKLYPVASYKNLLSAGTTQKGWNSRYWDSCKPHCSWMDNVDTSSQAAYAAAGYTVRNCNIHDIEIPTFTLSKCLERYWWGMEGVPSSCEVGAGGSFTCTDMAPIKVNDTLSYGFVAGPSNQGCGKCYHLQYDGSTHNKGNDGPDVKETHIALKGKHLVVMASNIGHDVDLESTQFDLLVPGGGVGIFNALSTQIGKTPEELGSNNGGVLSYCMDKLGYWQVTKEQYQECVIEKCDVVFDSTAWPHLNRGCKWLATFFEAADNPSFVWEEVECPQYLVDKYRTTLSLELETNVLYSEKWDNYKGDGQFITTDACSKTKNEKGEFCDPDKLAADKAKSY